LPWGASSDAIRASADGRLGTTTSNTHRKELADVKLLAISTTGRARCSCVNRGVKRPNDPVDAADRVPTPVVAKTMQGYGALPKTLAVTELVPALTKGEISGLVTQYRIVRTLKLEPFVNRVSEFRERKALYTAVYLIAMNKARFESLPLALQSVIEDRSGHRLSAQLVGKSTFGARGATHCQGRWGSTYSRSKATT